MLKNAISAIKKSDGLVRLIAINAIIFVVIQVVHIFSRFSENDRFVEAHPDLYLAATSNPARLLDRPWSIFTHMFTHEEVGHFIFNIFCLYTGGRLFRFFLGSKKLVVNYILGGLSGFLLFFIFFNLFPALPKDSYILGASAAVMSIIITVGVVQPNYRIKLFGVFEMKLMWLCIILVFVDLVSLRKGFNSGGHIGHLGGALFGLIYGLNFQKNRNMGSWLENLFAKISGMFGGKKSHLQTVHKRPITDDEFNAEKVKRQKRVDEILDKINRSGYESLSKEEKDYLFKYSQK
jgi:membrane associated rhomboid family serine protease